MASPTFEHFTSERLTDEILAEASRLFNENYGTWGDFSHNPGKPVKVSPRKLKEQYISSTDGSKSSLIRARLHGQIVGHAFVSRWKCKDWVVCWVTQLVVDRRYRRQGIATALLRRLRQDSDDVYGIMSSQPAACMAAANAFESCISTVDLDFISLNAQDILDTSPVPYVRRAKLRGTIFNEDDDESGMISSVNTYFFVDHSEPLEVLATVRREWMWPLGDLIEGHEFIALFQA